MKEAKAGGTPETTDGHQKLEAAGRIPLQRCQREHSPAHPSNSEFGLQNYARVSSTDGGVRTQAGPSHQGPRGPRDRQTRAQAQHLLRDHSGASPLLQLYL